MELLEERTASRLHYSPPLPSSRPIPLPSWAPSFLWILLGVPTGPSPWACCHSSLLFGSASIPQVNECVHTKAGNYLFSIKYRPISRLHPPILSHMFLCLPWVQWHQPSLVLRSALTISSSSLSLVVPLCSSHMYWDTLGCSSHLLWSFTWILRDPLDLFISPKCERLLLTFKLCMRPPGWLCSASWLI